MALTRSQRNTIENKFKKIAEKLKQQSKALANMVQKMSTDMNQKIAAVNTKYDRLSESISHVRIEASESHSAGSSSFHDNTSIPRCGESYQGISSHTI